MLFVNLRRPILSHVQRKFFGSASSLSSSSNSAPSLSSDDFSDDSSASYSASPSSSQTATETDLYRFTKVVPYDRSLPKEFLTNINEYLKENRYNRDTITTINNGDHTFSTPASALASHLHYIATRSPLEYVVIDRVLRETHKFLPGWTPKSIFDVGAKINNVLWCAKRIWGEKNIDSYTCVEDNSMFVQTSKDLLNTNELKMKFFRQLQLTSDPDAKRRDKRMLLSRDNNNNNNGSNEDETHQNDSSRGKERRGQPKKEIEIVKREAFVSADLTVCAYHLENVSNKKRKSYLRELWKRTDNVLVLISDSFDVISESREFLLREYPDCTVLAPCGHDKPCPMLRRTLLSGVKHECFFSHRMRKSDLPFRSPLRDSGSNSNNNSKNNKSSSSSSNKKISDVVLERFSYLVLRRKGSFNISLPPHTDMSSSSSSASVPLSLPPKKRSNSSSSSGNSEENKTAEEKEYEQKLAELEEEEFKKLANLSKEEVIEMFSVERPPRDPMTMHRIPEEDKINEEDEEDDAGDEFTKGWYTEEDEEQLPRFDLPAGVVSKTLEKEKRRQLLTKIEEEEREEGEDSEIEEEEGGDSELEEEEGFGRKKRRTRRVKEEDDEALYTPGQTIEGDKGGEEEKEDGDGDEDINYTPKKTWYSQKWSRVLSPPEKKIRHLVLDLCTPQGELDKHVLGKSQPTYRLARHLRWGDIWGFDRPPSKKENRTIRTWKFKNQQRRELKAQGKWAEVKAEFAKKKAVREQKLIEQGLLDEEERSKLTNQKPTKALRKKG